MLIEESKRSQCSVCVISTNTRVVRLRFHFAYCTCLDQKRQLREGFPLCPSNVQREREGYQPTNQPTPLSHPTISLSLSPNAAAYRAAFWKGSSLLHWREERGKERTTTNLEGYLQLEGAGKGEGEIQRKRGGALIHVLRT